MRVLRSLLAIVLGYVVMVSGTWFAQEVVFPDVEYGRASRAALVAMGIVTSAAGGLGGAVTALLAPRRPYLHLVPMAVLILVETTALYLQGRVNGPFWFEMLAAASLIGGTVAGAWAVVAIRGRLPASNPSAQAVE